MALPHGPLPLSHVVTDASDSARVGHVDDSRGRGGVASRETSEFEAPEEDVRRTVKQRKVGAARNTAEISQSDYLPTILRNQHFGGAVATPP